MNAPRSRRAQRGFTLIELLITLVIVAVGMLGLAKLQAAAVAESGVSRTRSLMTYQAESLAALMRANRAYWGAISGTAPGFSTTIGSAVISDAAGTLDATTAAAKGNCIAASASALPVCPAAAIAAADVQAWATNFAAQFPNAWSNVACTIAANVPTACDITLTWKEHYVGINRVATTASQDVNLILHVQP